MKTNKSNGLESIIAQAIYEMKEEQGKKFSPEKINLAELERKTGISRARLRRMKQNSFKDVPHGSSGRKRASRLDGYTGVIDEYLKSGVTNSSVILGHLYSLGYQGKQSILKDYIKRNHHLVPAKRQLVAPQGSRGKRYTTDPGEAFQMDWGFTKVTDVAGAEFMVACFAMICHHCGERYIEFFPNAKQENLFIGMLRGFNYMGIPEYILTDNMKSVVTGRDCSGLPLWNHDYEAFMKTVGFRTKLCKPRHPFTKGKVERLVRFVKDNFLAQRAFYNISDLNDAALEWCSMQNKVFHKSLDGIPHEIHLEKCSKNLHTLDLSENILLFLCPVRTISFDGFISYEGRRFGVPYYYTERTARIMRDGTAVKIYSTDLKQLLATHPVTWSKKDRFCPDQYLDAQPEELPTMPVKTQIQMLEEPVIPDAFQKFNFMEEA